MGACFVKQPNGLFCRFSTIVDCPTHYNMTKEDIKTYLMRKAEAEIDERINNLENKPEWGWTFEDVKSNTIIGNNITQEEWNQILKEVQP